MSDDTESDYCDRLPGQHTGRLSLELQASEAAEWQLRLEQMEKETQRLRHWIARQESKIRELTASPAAGESAPISPEVPQAHGLTTPATPSAACVGPTGQEIRSWWMRLLGHSPEEIASSPPVTDVADELRQLRAAIELHGGATPSAAVGASEPGAGDKPFQLEYGKRYLRRNGEVSGELITTPTLNEYVTTHPFWDTDHGLSYRSDGSYIDDLQPDVFDLVSEYIESPPAESPDPLASTADRLRKFSEQLESGEPIKATRIERHDTPDGPLHVRTQTEMKPAESPDDWVMITDPDHVPRVGIDYFEIEENTWARMDHGHTKESVGEYAKNTGGLRHRCRRKDLPVVPDESPALPSPWRQMTEDPPDERERLGRLVRGLWLEWAEQQPNPKPSWLLEYDQLPESDKEADRVIGMGMMHEFMAETTGERLRMMQLKQYAIRLRDQLNGFRQLFDDTDPESGFLIKEFDSFIAGEFPE